MSAIFTNVLSMHGVGIFADRAAKSESLGFRRYNLIYGFNGSGKSTLSRIFNSLEAGELNRRLPADCSFELPLDDGTSFSCPGKLSGLQRRIAVFNDDFVEKNFQWSVGQANPVFFIGASQAAAAADLKTAEDAAAKLHDSEQQARIKAKSAQNLLRMFRREQAKLIASHLHLGNRKYEAPAFLKDYELWKASDPCVLSDDEFAAAEDLRRLSDPMPRLNTIEIDVNKFATAYEFVANICGQSLTKVTIREVEIYPDILMWLKQGHDFHASHKLANCLFCSNPITDERSNLLASAFDANVDRFINLLTKAAERLAAVRLELVDIIQTLPSPHELAAELKVEFQRVAINLKDRAKNISDYLEAIQDVLTIKRERPASPADVSSLADISVVKEAVEDFGVSIEAVNDLFKAHNDGVSEFAKRREDAETAIRQHFIALNREEYEQHVAEDDTAQGSLSSLAKRVKEQEEIAAELRRKVREHGPAADAINRLVTSYLGHGELTVQPLDDGYQIQRNGHPISGAPSEGEKTAIAIAYFLSSVESDGRRMKDMVVVIDDPVSSLDTRALNYACTLVRSRLQDAAQLFILTHNLQCMTEFRKAWKTKARPLDDSEPTAAFLFIDVTMPEGTEKRSARIQQMDRLLREYDSEYHFLFSHVLRFTAEPNTYYDYSYMMPNVLRRVLDVFLAFNAREAQAFRGRSGSYAQITLILIEIG